MPDVKSSINELLNQLSSSDFFEREEAVKLLAGINQDTAIAGLVIALEDEDRGIRELAADNLVGIGGNTCSHLLANFMGHNDISVRNLAAEVLVRIGRSAVPALVEALNNPDHDIRKFALDVLGLIKDSSVVGQIIPMLRDPNQNVTCSAAETLGCLGSAEAVGPLLEAMERQEYLRVQAAEALGRIGDATAFSGLRKYLMVDDPVVQYSAIEAIGTLGKIEAVDDLMPFLEGGNDLMADAATAATIKIARANGHSAFKYFPEKKLKQFLLESLRSEDPSVAAFALNELRHWNEPDIVDELIRLLIKAEGELKEQITEVLRYVGTPAVEALTKRLHKGTDEERVALMEIIAASGDLRLADMIIPFADSPNALVREKTAVALGRCGNAESMSSLVRLSADSVGHVRAAAVKAMGWLTVGDKEIEALIARLDDDYPDVREAAMGAIILTGGCRVIQTFTKDLEHENPERQRLAAVGLGLIGEEEAKHSLIGATAHSDPSVRRSAIEALGRIGDLDDLGPIRAGLVDEDSLVRKAAVTAMVSFLGTAAVDDIKHLLDDDDIWVRYHTIDQIGSVGDLRFAQLLFPYIQDDQDIIKIAAIKALAAMGDSSCLPHLKRMATGGNQDLVKAIKEATRVLTEVEHG